MYDGLRDDEIRPAICLNGDEPFGCDQLEGLFRRYDAERSIRIEPRVFMETQTFGLYLEENNGRKRPFEPFPLLASWKIMKLIGSLDSMNRKAGL